MLKNELYERFIKLYSEKGLNLTQIKNLEEKLRVTLPKDLKNILQYYDGYYSINGMSLFYVVKWDRVNILAFRRTL